MEILSIKNLTFAYPQNKENTLKNINLSVEKGSLTILCGRSGSGKSTLLQLIKPAVAPYGRKTGEIIFDGENVENIPFDRQSREIGFVAQSPENQIVTDKVWHELAFGAESLGMNNSQMRARTAKAADFFGIEDKFESDTNTLSGGQKQLLNLAAVTVMNPKLIIADEPTSALDKFAAFEFVDALQSLIENYGTTCIIAAHNAEIFYPAADRIVLMDKGEIVADIKPGEYGMKPKDAGLPVYGCMPAGAKIKLCAGMRDKSECAYPCPINIQSSRDYICRLKEKEYHPQIICESNYEPTGSALKIEDLYFSYDGEKKVLDGFNLRADYGKITALVGNNGAGKSTLFSLVAGNRKAQSGKIYVDSELLTDKSDIFDPDNKKVAFMPQSCEILFSQNSVIDELTFAALSVNLPDEERKRRIREAFELCDLYGLENNHPYDLSGGERRRLALAVLIIFDPKIFLLDEPTRGADYIFVEQFERIIKALANKNKAFVIITHDMQLCAEAADSVCFIAKGKNAFTGTPREFFENAEYAKPQSMLVSEGILENCITESDILSSLGLKKPIYNDESEKEKILPEIGFSKPKEKKHFQKKHLYILMRITAIALIALVMLAFFGFINTPLLTGSNGYLICAAALFLFGFTVKSSEYKLPKREKIKYETEKSKDKSKRRFAHVLNIILTFSFVLVLMPLTVAAGIIFFDDRKYLFISLLLIIQALIIFFVSFEGRHPSARESVTVAVYCALAAAGRAAFYALPEFKPTAAISVIAGATLGPQTGFLVGNISMLVSNMMFGQGPWTPWQMFAMGSVGFLSGLIFSRKQKKSRVSLCIYGFLSVLLIYGPIMNLSAAITAQEELTLPLIASYLISGLYPDTVHALASSAFLFMTANPLVEKTERIKNKYGLNA